MDRLWRVHQAGREIQTIPSSPHTLEAGHFAAYACGQQFLTEDQDTARPAASRRLRWIFRACIASGEPANWASPKVRWQGAVAYVSRAQWARGPIGGQHARIEETAQALNDDGRAAHHPDDKSRSLSCKTGWMNEWDLTRLAWRPHHPEILSSTGEGRAIVLDLPAGEMLQDHQVHEGAWITVIYGEVKITSHTGKTIDAQPGTLVQFAPQERHEVKALADSRMLLLLTPWPGPGHPGTMTIEQKTGVRERAAERAS